MAGGDGAQQGNVNAEPFEAAEFGAAVGTGLGVDVGAGLIVEAPEGNRSHFDPYI